MVYSVQDIMSKNINQGHNDKKYWHHLLKNLKYINEYFNIQNKDYQKESGMTYKTSIQKKYALILSVYFILNLSPVFFL